MTDKLGKLDENGRRYTDHPHLGRIYKNWSCPDCGKKVEDWANQCPVCGHIREKGRGVLNKVNYVHTPESEEDGEADQSTAERAFHRGKKEGLQTVIHDVIHELPGKDEEITSEEIIGILKKVRRDNARRWRDKHDTPVSSWERRIGDEP